MPAEWEQHDRCWMAWPCRIDFWGENLGATQLAYARVANAIAEFEPVTMLEYRAVPVVPRGELHVEPILVTLGVGIGRISERPAHRVQVAKTHQRWSAEVVVPGNSTKDLVEIRGDFPQTDLSLGKEKFELSGYTKQNDSVASFFSVFRNVGKGRIRAQNILPQNTAMFMSIGFEDFNDFYDRFETFYAICLCSLPAALPSITSKLEGNLLASFKLCTDT